MKDALAKYNYHKLDEDIPWGYLSRTEKKIISLGEEVNKYSKIEKKMGRDTVTKTNNRNGKNKK